jgi:hypothetical protein
MLNRLHKQMQMLPLMPDWIVLLKLIWPILEMQALRRLQEHERLLICK